MLSFLVLVFLLVFILSSALGLVQQRRRHFFENSRRVLEEEKIQGLSNWTTD